MGQGTGDRGMLMPVGIQVCDGYAPVALWFASLQKCGSAHTNPASRRLPEASGPHVTQGGQVFRLPVGAGGRERNSFSSDPLPPELHCIQRQQPLTSIYLAHGAEWPANVAVKP